MAGRLPFDRMVGLILVIGAHALAFYGLWSYRILPSPAEALTVFVNFINPPPAKEPPQPAPPKPVKLEKPRPVEPPRPQQLVAEAPVISPAEPVAPAPPKEPPAVIAAPAAPPAPPPKPAGPVTLADELSVACPNRTPPAYPAFSRRTGEQGRVILRVELDERGSVTQASVATSSGSPRLDEAALAAVRQWRCNPALRGGVPVRAVALQPFNFVLEGR